MKIISRNVAELQVCYAKVLEIFFIKEDAKVYLFRETKILSERVPMRFKE